MKFERSLHFDATKLHEVLDHLGIVNALTITDTRTNNCETLPDLCYAFLQ